MTAETGARLLSVPTGGGAAPSSGEQDRKTTLVIMAAGMASRYGGNKQTDGIGPHQETLMEYSVYDALQAGFRKIVWIIKPDMREKMEAYIRPRLEKTGAETAFAFQDFSSIPDFYRIPAGRAKPFGTGHALLCAADVVAEPFCVINADDYYGADAYRQMRRALTRLPEAGQAVMVGYVLRDTLSPSGTVSRGICEVEGTSLRGVTERLKIGTAPDGSLWDADSGVSLSPEETVSMNCWGFAPSFFPALRRCFEEFLRVQARDNPTAECHLPTVVSHEMAAGHLSVSVLPTSGPWFGMTYREDRQMVAERLREMYRQGVYPDNLWT